MYFEKKNYQDADVWKLQIKLPYEDMIDHRS